MTNSTYPPALIRATLPLAILACLETAPAHGYGLAQHLEHWGYGKLKGGSLYPALSKLEDAGFVTTSWEQGQNGPARRLYEISGAGRRYLETERTQLAELAQRLGALPVAVSTTG